jgi:ABC-type uncharacterized transport system permease subunit
MKRLNRVEEFILRRFNLIRTVIAVLLGSAIAAVVILLLSKTPGVSLLNLFLGVFKSRTSFANLFETTTPLLYCGVALCIPFQAHQFNVGAEGSFYLGAAVGTAFALSVKLPPVIAPIAVLAVAALTGAIWGFIPGWFKARFHADELVASLMLNYVAYFIGLYLINHHFRDTMANAMVSLHLPADAVFAEPIQGTRLHIGIPLAFLVACLMYIFIYHTKLGYQIRMTGSNIHFADYGGIDTRRSIILSQVIGMAIAGMGGMVDVMGLYGRFQWQSLPGYGWDGVVVVTIARSNPLLCIPAALFLAYLKVGGQMMSVNGDIPAEMISVVESIIILLVTAEAFLETIRYRLTVKKAGETHE